MNHAKQGELFIDNDKISIIINNFIWEKLAKSTFRSQFHLNQHDLQYAIKKGPMVLAQHAIDFIINRLSAKEPKNDGKQTPFKGHPVFVAQHATATCCRSCIQKWHHFPKHTPLTIERQYYLQQLIMQWINQECHFDQ